MKAQFKDQWDFDPQKKEKTISEIIDESNLMYVNDITRLQEKLDKSNKLQEALIDVLHAKGVLDDADIKTLFMKILPSIDENSFKVLPAKK